MFTTCKFIWYNTILPFDMLIRICDIVWISSTNVRSLRAIPYWSSWFCHWWRIQKSNGRNNCCMYSQSWRYLLHIRFCWENEREKLCFSLVLSTKSPVIAHRSCVLASNENLFLLYSWSCLVHKQRLLLDITRVVEYGRGFLPFSLPFQVADSIFGTMDFVAMFKLQYQYAKCMMYELLVNRKV